MRAILLLFLLLLPLAGWAETPAPNQPIDSPAVAETTTRPGGTLWQHMESLKTITFGPENGRILYVFMDPACPFCHKFYDQATAQIAAGTPVQLRIIPVGLLSAESFALASKILSSEDPMHAWAEWMQNPDTALQPPAADKQQNIIINTQTMKDWGLDMIPFLFWKNDAGQVMMIKGMPDDSDTFWQNEFGATNKVATP